MPVIRSVTVLGGVFALAACANVPPVVGVPGPNKDAAAFQKDETACRQQAATAASTGTQAVPPPSSTARWDQYFASYTACESAHGNAVAEVPWPVAYAASTGAPVPYAYAYAYAYAYGYGYPYFFGDTYPVFFGGYYGFGYGRRFGFYHGGYGHGGHR